MMLICTLHTKFFCEDMIQSSGTPRNTELALYGNGISSGQNIYKWQANANHGLPMIAETLHQNFMQHR